MKFLTSWYREHNALYHGPEGDRLALEELTPVADRFLGGGAVLEVGCGYGRNLVGLAATRARLVVGCDPARAELERAKAERVSPLAEERRGKIALVHQEPFRLPFPDGSFDLVVLWQVLEHVFQPIEKQKVLDECVRVLKSGGHLLVETPNQWFPFDYHDNRMPLVHWVLPRAGREWVTWKIRGMRYHPSQYLSLGGYERMIRRAPGLARLARVSKLAFFRGWGEAYANLGGTQVGLKRLVYLAIAPLHATLALFGGSADHFLPSLRVVWRVEKSGAVVGSG
jgi:SAM-dependent methyltransferase